MKLTVKKWDKSKEPYDQAKIRRTLQKYGLKDNEIEVIIKKVENRLYDGIPTKEILSILHEEIEQARYHVKKNDLKEALAMMRSAPDLRDLFRTFSGDWDTRLRQTGSYRGTVSPMR